MIDLSPISSEVFFYASPDIRRALGLEKVLRNYFIICSFHDLLVDLVRKKGTKVYCLEDEIGDEALQINNTGQLVDRPEVKKFIHENTDSKRPNLLYFKPSLKIDIICQKENFVKVANSYELNEQFENKINFFNITEKYFPEAHIEGMLASLPEVEFSSVKEKLGLPFVVQFGHGWAGKTTFFIGSKNALMRLTEKYPSTRVKIVKYIKGPTYLNNCCIYNNKVFVSEPARQLSGISKIYDNESVTVGRQWPSSQLNKNQIETIKHLSVEVGQFMAKSGFRGYFGLDFIVEEKSGKVYLSENNARFTASVPFYTKLELKAGRIPLLAYHIAAFSNRKFDRDYLPKGNIKGSQIIIRNEKKDNIRVNSGFKTGTYLLNDRKLIYIDDRFDISDIKPNEFIIIPEYHKKQVANGQEMARIELPNIALTPDVNLKDDVADIIDQVKELIV